MCSTRTACSIPAKSSPTAATKSTPTCAWARVTSCPCRLRPCWPLRPRTARSSANLEQCNGCGGCRKETPTMCPTFLATGEEIMSTRGRANAIRAALELRGIGDPLRGAEMEAALSNCLSCKACTSGMSFQRQSGLAQGRIAARPAPALRPFLARTAFQLRGFAGAAGLPDARAWPTRLLRSGPDAAAGEKPFGISAQRPLPPYALERFDHWFARRGPSPAGKRGRVIFWDDTFVRYHEPHIGAGGGGGAGSGRISPALVARPQMLRTPRLQPGLPGHARPPWAGTIWNY